MANLGASKHKNKLKIIKEKDIQIKQLTRILILNIVHIQITGY